MTLRLFVDYDGGVFTPRQWEARAKAEEEILCEWVDCYVQEMRNFEKWLERSEHSMLTALSIGLETLYGEFQEYVYDHRGELYDGNELLHDHDDYEEVFVEITEEDLC